MPLTWPPPELVAESSNFSVCVSDNNNNTFAFGFCYLKRLISVLIWFLFKKKECELGKARISGDKIEVDERNKKIQLDLESNELYYNSTKFPPRFYAYYFTALLLLLYRNIFIFYNKIIIITTVLLFQPCQPVNCDAPYIIYYYFFLYWRVVCDQSGPAA